jgi:hypothetical protein
MLFKSIKIATKFAYWMSNVKVNLATFFRDPGYELLIILEGSAISVLLSMVRIASAISIGAMCEGKGFKILVTSLILPIMILKGVKLGFLRLL